MSLFGKPTHTAVVNWVSNRRTRHSELVVVPVLPATSNPAGSPPPYRCVGYNSGQELMNCLGRHQRDDTPVLRMDQLSPCAYQPGS